MNRLEGKTAIITGGASGIGAASVRLFVKEGARVLVADAQTERGEALAEELGDVAIFQRVDVTREEDIRSAVNDVMKRWGRVGQPEDIARAALWLASDESEWITGHAQVVDGGAYAGRPWSRQGEWITADRPIKLYRPEGR